MAPCSLWRSALLAVAAAITHSGSPRDGCPAARCQRDSLVHAIDALERKVEYLQKDLPPPELFAPPLNDVPVLTAATSNTLRFDLNIAKKNGNCPSHVVWTYKGNSDLTAKTNRTVNYKSHIGVCLFSITLSGLSSNTVYQLQAQPMGQNERIQWNWYNKTDTPKYPSSYPAFATTCSENVPGITGLMIHSVGSKWLGLSWIPPEFDCLTNLEYRVRHSSNKVKSNDYQMMGSFRSNNLLTVSGRVSPCVAWPDRHCLVLVMDTKEKSLVTIHVRRDTDDRQSERVNVTLSLTTLTCVPGPPRHLRLVEARATALVLRWASPLVLGRRLDKVVIQVRSPDGKERKLLPTIITLCPEYERTIENLEENTEYTVDVWFTSTTGEEGYKASLTARTLPLPTTTSTTSTTTTTTTSTDTPTSLMETSMCVSSPLPHQLLSVQNEEENQWIWVAACSVLLVLVFVAFFVGRRCGTQKQWKSSRLEETKSCNGTGKKGAVGGEGEGDRAVLCAARAGGGACTPPAFARDYAEVEVDLSTGRAWAVARPSNLYEELRGGGDDDAPRAAKDYANVGARGEVSTPHYAEVHAPPPLPPPASKPTPAPAPALTPVYAEVDLEKKHAQRRK